MDWSWLAGGYDRMVVGPGKQPVLLLLIGLVVGFVAIRTSTRLIRAQVRWWPGNVSAGGVHLHHELFGVLLMLVTGAAGFTITSTSRWWDLLPLAFGIGAGLVLDEFALLLHLKDVYWSRQGRTSVDAVVVAVLLTCMVLVSASPFGVDDITSAEASARWSAVGLVLVSLALTVVTALKGKLWVALFSVCSPAVGIVGALRLATPTSPWARRFYPRHSHLMDRATERAERWNRRKQRLVTLVGGAPTPVPPAQRTST